VPAAFAPPDALASPADAAGLDVAAPVAAGGYVTAGALAPPGAEEAEPGPPLRRGERALELAVAGGAGLEPGVRADVLVTVESRAGAGRTYVALEDVEVLALRAGGDGAEPPGGAGGSGAAEPASATATLRVTARQAVHLTAARAFARDVRLLARPPGDRRAVGAIGVGSDEL
jgi:pilus assembly protein CpaB